MKFYRSVITVEILSDEQLPDGMDLQSVYQEITSGGSSGMVEHPVWNEEVTERHMAELLTAQGSDPGFLIPEGRLSEQ